MRVTLCLLRSNSHGLTRMPYWWVILQRIAASLLQRMARSSTFFAAMRQGPGLSCGSSLRKGEVLAYVGTHQNLKDPRENRTCVCLWWAVSKPEGPETSSKRTTQDRNFQNLKDLKQSFEQITQNSNSQWPTGGTAKKSAIS